MKIKFKNLTLVIRERLSASNFYIIRDTIGLFNTSSHISSVSQKEKVMYKTKESSKKACLAMEKKHKVGFSSYKCLYCDGFHIGKNKY